ncbi:response regulator transcription factor [Erythrobacter sp. AP23]|uniref:response regulator transcription factor n=1 Tax=Erythrobacter sp. AP23 TaxID=499656 RepID=UPI00076C5687|nr:LuxR C-terminal-related transcriptional regulator [Erythrobacter sp. AP23]KWV94266.1 helix-turn-helix transcriptional regulator [Erythrobacter sp. AP23]
MKERQILHIVGGSSRCRAEQSHLVYELGHHCETYSDAHEFLERPPEEGVILARDDPGRGGAAGILSALAGNGVWFPVIATAPEPRPGNVVNAVKAGALDYLSLPLRPTRLAQALQRISEDLDVYTQARRRMVEARSRIASLSPREREVLDWLAEGCSNKAIASKLNISPRTVENHRANLMSKLRAEHPAQAVRLQLEAHLEDSVRETMG